MCCIYSELADDEHDADVDTELIRPSERSRNPLEAAEKWVVSDFTIFLSGLYYHSVQKSIWKLLARLSVNQSDTTFDS